MLAGKEQVFEKGATMRYPYATGDNGETVEEIIEGLITNGATGLSILAALKESLSDEEWGEIVQSFGIYYAS
jgi:hypothetical protein